MTFSDEPGSPSVDAAFIVGFLICAGLWATYFLRTPSAASRRSRRPGGRGQRRAAGYAYAHAMMVAGVIVVAVAIRLTIDNPDGTASAASA